MKEVVKCNKCGEEMEQIASNNWVCHKCGIGKIDLVKATPPTNMATSVRKNYDKVINSLYRALYAEEPLTDDELKLIIDYVMEEYK